MERVGQTSGFQDRVFPLAGIILVSRGLSRYLARYLAVAPDLVRRHQRAAPGSIIFLLFKFVFQIPYSHHIHRLIISQPENDASNTSSPAHRKSRTPRLRSGKPESRRATETKGQTETGRRRLVWRRGKPVHACQKSRSQRCPSYRRDHPSGHSRSRHIRTRP
jgi:hypothetical protein